MNPQPLHTLCLVEAALNSTHSVLPIQIRKRIDILKPSLENFLKTIENAFTISRQKIVLSRNGEVDYSATIEGLGPAGKKTFHEVCERNRLFFVKWRLATGVKLEMRSSELTEALEICAVHDSAEVMLRVLQSISNPRWSTLAAHRSLLTRIHEDLSEDVIRTLDEFIELFRAK